MKLNRQASALVALVVVASCSSLITQAGRLEADGDEASAGGSVQWQPPSFCRGKDCPEFEVLQTRDDVELRHYKRAHWISTNVSNAKWSEAYDEGYKRLQKYVSGENVNSTKLPQTNPSFTLLYVADPKAHTMQTTYTIEYFVPFELQEKPPQPNSTDLAVTPVDEQEVWVVAFGGFATEEIVIQRGFEFIANLTGDGIDVHTEFIGLALYDQPARLIKRHNELWLWSKTQPSAALRRTRTTAGGGTENDDDVGAVLRFKRMFEAVVKRVMGGRD
ncbi:hypothetical protein Vretimale_11435 [Volvox reticuliferus]|uniref:Heme-binding protein 2 n=1 Tax=Volvox reticuliferus TaxID=1737510 RepID=A0A8J4FQI7_9CHLO|nr:hypothetical protein Vretifemale_11983 [Volvox reticuliferus]GIM07237.1 hypothetical protein Vretimale_11435 [Volvox reticuliferus]